jgi:hypothetical protein
MILRHRSWAVLAISCLGVVAPAQAALEKSLHEVNTSVGLKPTNATNQLKLETDPSIPAGSSDTTDSSYIPIAGAIDNTYDPSQFKLAIDPNTATYALGYSVQGIDPFEVDSFQVLDTNGGFYTVSMTSDPNVDTVTPSTDPAPNGIEAGKVNLVTFGLIPSMKNLALPATQDQNFFELNLVALNGSPDIIPENYSTGGGPGCFLQLGNPGGTIITLTDGVQGPDGQIVVFNASIVPEPASVGLLGITAVGLMGRRRRR